MRAAPGGAPRRGGRAGRAGVSLAGSLLAGSLLAGCELPRGDGDRPDIILVSIDSLRADHLSSYGYDRPTTPNLDALAADGLRFTRARSASPWTLPSHLTMLTGRWPTDHQVVEDDLALAPDVPVVTEALRAAGYATAAFVSTVYVSGGYGFARGFDRYEDYAITERENLAHAVRVDRIVQDAREWVKQNGKGKPVFLFLHIYDVHYPYVPPKPWDETFDRPGEPEELKYRKYGWYLTHPIPKRRMAHLVAQYDESLAWVDDELGKLRSAWRWSFRPAWWIVTADHGEEFGERGSWGHAHTLHPEVLDIPLLVSGPDIDPAVRDDLVGTIDIAPSIAALAGVPFSGGGDGVDLRTPAPPRTFYAETSRFDAARLSIQRDGRRLDLDLAHGKRTLYDLAADPAEGRPVGDPAEVHALEGRLLDALGAPWVAEVGPLRSSGWMWTPGGRPTPTLDAPLPGAPLRFGVYPPDAEVRIEGQPPVRAPAGAPATGPVRYEGAHRATAFDLGDEVRAQLEALGYVQEAGE